MLAGFTKYLHKCLKLASFLIGIDLATATSTEGLISLHCEAKWCDLLYIVTISIKILAGNQSGHIIEYNQLLMVKRH